MKRTNLFLAAFVSLGFIFASCGGSTDSSEANSNDTEVSEDEMAVDNAEVKEFNVNTESSKVKWSGGIVSGMYGHEGTLSLKEGSLTITGSTVTDGSFVVDMTDITPTDDNYNAEEGKTADKLVGHLSSPDFFDIENNPTASFEITGVDGSKVTGNLTVRGVTNEETVENVTVTEEAGQTMVTGDLTFDRQKYNVKYALEAKDMVLSDDIKLNIELIAGKESTMAEN